MTAPAGQSSLSIALNNDQIRMPFRVSGLGRREEISSARQDRRVVFQGGENSVMHLWDDHDKLLDDSCN